MEIHRAILPMETHKIAHLFPPVLKTNYYEYEALIYSNWVHTDCSKKKIHSENHIFENFSGQIHNCVFILV